MLNLPEQFSHTIAALQNVAKVCTCITVKGCGLIINFRIWGACSFSRVSEDGEDNFSLFRVP